MVEALDIRERGALKGGQPQFSQRRLWMQLQAFGGCRDAGPPARALEEAGVEGVLYEDLQDPCGVGLLVLSEDPDFLVSRLRGLLRKPPFARLRFKPEYSMLGRTYSLGHEPDLDDWLRARPRRTALNREWPWAIWYPLRRTGAFNALAPEEQVPILREHGKIGRAFGEADHAHDIRLACFGVDKNDNDFVIGLVGKELHPLSACVEAMRKTRQTSQFIQAMGPFFVGKAAWRSPSADR